MFAEINETRLLKTFMELVSIYAPSRKEAALAMRLKELFSELGAEVTIDDSSEITGSNTGNLRAFFPGNKPGTIIFASHMDSVEPCIGIEPYVDSDGVIRSKGETILGSDDKVGIAAMLELLYMLNESGASHPDIVCLCTVQEEVGLVGAQNLNFGPFGGEPCFVLDSDGAPGLVMNKAACHFAFKATFIGIPSHAGVCPEKGKSAIRAASMAIASLPQGKISDEATFNVGTISGGSADNVVPGSCVVTGEFRAFDESMACELWETAKDLIETAAASCGCSVETNVEMEYGGFEVDENDPLLQMVKEACENCSLEFICEPSMGGSDANVLGMKNLRPLVLGTGMTDFHSVTEHIRVQDLCDLTRLIYAIAVSYK